MSEALNCVFIPPNFTLNDISSITIFYEKPPEESYSLSMEVDSNVYNLKEGFLSSNKITWSLDEIENFQSLSPDSTQFIIHPPDSPPISFDLSKITFLGPIKNANPPNNIYLLEFISGYYCRSEDFTEETVSFTIESILTLDYRNVQTIRQQLEDLNTAKKAFEETKQHLSESGINLEELTTLKKQYEDTMSQKRIVQHEFLHQNQRLQAAMIHSQAESDREAAVQSLKKHIEQNKTQTPPKEPTLEEQMKLVNFRLAALEELKLIFPFAEKEGRLCSVQFFSQPSNSVQWAETRAFLGFATHYIREISRIVGIPLQYLLIPRASSSQIICRLTDEKKNNSNRRFSKRPNNKL